MKAILLFFGIFLSISSFGLEPTVEALLQKIQAQNPRHRTDKITKWLYKGKVFYELNSMLCCDIPNVLFDENGEKYCSLGAGFDDKIDSKCKDFFENDAKKLLGTLKIKSKN